MDATLIGRRQSIRRTLSNVPRGISRNWLQGVLVANLAGQVLIVVSGGIVRLTRSGLGCPTFPECVRGSFVPVVTQPQGFHKYIEFGNRMLVFVLAVLAIGAFVAVLQQVRDGGASRLLLAPGAVPFVGVILQALIGGLSVLTKLNPAVVAVHFLSSMGLIAGSTLLLMITMQTAGQPVASPQNRVGRRGRWLAAALGLAIVPVLVLGTVVTGSGPHSGDVSEASRFHFAIPTVARLHAGAVGLFVLLLLALIGYLRHSDGPAAARRDAAILLAITLAQGAIGYLQYALSVPIALVAVHMLGASLLVVATTATVFAVFAPRLTIFVRQSALGELSTLPGEHGA